MIRKFSLTLAVITAVSLSLANAQQTEKVTPSGIGYLEYLPPGYNSSHDKYPLVISLHGIREKGTASTDRQRVLADLQKVDNVGLPKYVKNGKKYPFILISPQLKSNYGSWPPSLIMEVLRHVRKYLRVDDRRIYLTGLSLGGLGVWKTAGEYPDVFAAIAPICPGGNALRKAKQIAASNVAAWGFHGDDDKIVHFTVTTKMINAMNSAPKKPNPLAKATLFRGMGHGVWDKAYNETNLLEWMLRQRKGSAPSGPEEENGDDGQEKDPSKKKPSSPEKKKNESKNVLPVASAGPDRVLTLPTNSVTIQGKASDRDGRIISWNWARTYGKQVVIRGANSPRVTLSDMTAGVYIFRLRVTDNDGGVKDDYFKITVTGTSNARQGTSNKHTPASRSNRPPYAYAGPDRVLTLPQNAITIDARASDSDGRIVSYQWAKTYGNRATLAGARSSRVHISNLTPGVYIFRLTVKDNDGSVKHDYFKITVKGEKVAARNDHNQRGSGNTRPVAYAGTDRKVSVTRRAVTLHGSGRDNDGRVVSYQWKKLSGPPVTIRNAKSAQPTIGNLKEGHYYFSLTVEDDDEARHVDKMALRVTGG